MKKKVKATKSKAVSAPRRASSGKKLSIRSVKRSGSTLLKRISTSIASKLSTVGKTSSMMTDAQIRKMPASAYMNDVQLSFFKARLLQQRVEVLSRQSEVKDRLNQHENFADPADRASAEEEHWLDLRLRERESFLLRKIDDALRRISEREYGFCKVTGESIGIPRLLARPTAEVCVDVKGLNEHVEAQFRDR